MFIESTPESWLTFTFESLVSFLVRKQGGDFGGNKTDESEGEVGDLADEAAEVEDGGRGENILRGRS